MNKKFLSVILLLSVAVLCLFGFTACKKDKSDESVKHVHEYVETVVEPTCTEIGYTLHKCDCGEEYRDDEIVASGHRYGKVTYSWSSDNLTCTATRICNNGCNHEETETVNVTITIIQTRTCELDELKTYVAIFKNTAFEKQSKEKVKTADKLGHTSAPVVEENRVEATCENEGSYDLVVYCSTCSEEINREHKTITVLGHNYIHYNEKLATCTVDGYKAYDKCSRCDYTTYEKIDALGHINALAVEENRVEATCENEGSYDLVVYCSTCGEEINREHKTIDKLKHDFSDDSDYCKNCKTPYITEGLEYELVKNDSDLYYKVVGKGTVTDTRLGIPRTHNGLPVKEVGENAFIDWTDLISVIIPDSVTMIGGSAFNGCSSLEKITIPFVGAKAGVTANDAYQYPFGYIFGTNSYEGGTKTYQTYYSSSTSSTTESYYYIPSSLKTVTITGGEILHGAFRGCSGLISIIIPDSATSIGGYAFYYCKNLVDIIIPDGVTSLNQYAFSDCSNLTNIIIPNSVTSIGGYAFYNCNSLASITIGNNVASIGASAFA